MFNNINELEVFLNQNQAFDFLGVDRLGVFGSFARGEKANDIDLLISSSEKGKLKKNIN